MSSLRELQRQFAEAIYRDGGDVYAHVRHGRFPPARHLQVYRNNVHASLTEALAAVYPVVQRLVGDDCFQNCVRAYLRQSPLVSGNLLDFGDRFAGFLAHFEVVRELVYLPDVARLEWIWHLAFHAADSDGILLDALSRVTADRYAELHFRLHPSVQLLQSDYPVLRIWQANQPDQTVSGTIRLDEGGVRLLVARRGLTVNIEALDPGEYLLLRTLATASFGQAAEAALAAEPEFDLARTLQTRVADQTIVGFSINDNSVEETS